MDKGVANMIEQKWVGLFSIAFIFVFLTGCVAAMVGGGAAGGYYVGKNYEITKKPESGSSS